MRKRRPRPGVGPQGDSGAERAGQLAILAHARMRAALRDQPVVGAAGDPMDRRDQRSHEGPPRESADAVAGPSRADSASPVDLNDVVMTREELAAYFKLNAKTITAHINKRGLPARKIGREYRFLRSEVLAWMKNLPPSTVKP